MLLVIERVGYETLRDQIVQVLQTGKELAQRAVEEEPLHTYHEISQFALFARWTGLSPLNLADRQLGLPRQVART